MGRPAVHDLRPSGEWVFPSPPGLRSPGLHEDLGRRNPWEQYGPCPVASTTVPPDRHPAQGQRDCPPQVGVTAALPLT